MVQPKQPISQDKNNHIFSSCTNSVAPITNALSSFHVELFCLGKELREKVNDTKTMRPIFKCRRTYGNNEYRFADLSYALLQSRQNSPFTIIHNTITQKRNLRIYIGLTLPWSWLKSRWNTSFRRVILLEERLPSKCVYIFEVGYLVTWHYLLKLIIHEAPLSPGAKQILSKIKKNKH